MNGNAELLLQAHIAARPEATALLIDEGYQERRYSFGQLEAGISRLAARLQALGVKPGVRVAVLVSPSFELTAAFFALLRLGAIGVYADSGAGLRALARSIEEGAPEVLICSPMARLLRWAFPSAFGSVKQTLNLAIGSLDTSATAHVSAAFVAGEAPAMVVFTSGTTGPAKGVVMEHRTLKAELSLVRDTFGLQPAGVDLGTFAFFALLSPALGRTVVLPPIDFMRPGKVQAARLLESARRYGTSAAFGNPAIWERVVRECALTHTTLAPLTTVVVSGAAVQPGLLRQLEALLPPGGLVHTPYGQTEAVPLANVWGEALRLASEQTLLGAGVCVGKAVRGIEVRVIGVDDAAISHWTAPLELVAGQVGEVLVRGANVSPRYWARPEAQALAKIEDHEGGPWHRTGDLGRLDEAGRLWLVGRKAQRVHTDQGLFYPECVEAIFNAVPGIRRCALVGVGQRPEQRAVLVVELAAGETRARAKVQLEQARLAHPGLPTLCAVLFHRRLPVDPRHNSKVVRESVALWASRQPGVAP